MYTIPVVLKRYNGQPVVHFYTSRRALVKEIIDESIMLGRVDEAEARRAELLATKHALLPDTYNHCSGNGGIHANDYFDVTFLSSKTPIRPAPRAGSCGEAPYQYIAHYQYITVQGGKSDAEDYVEPILCNFSSAEHMRREILGEMGEMVGEGLAGATLEEVIEAYNSYDESARAYTDYIYVVTSDTEIYVTGWWPCEVCGGRPMPYGGRYCDRCAGGSPPPEDVDPPPEPLP